ncbi:MAG: DUF6057 family protein [Bacteroidales bacterium]|nr:DUF6057 family protein [Bacteroidales bacterium]
MGLRRKILKEKYRDRYAPWVAALCVGLAAFAFFFFFYPYHLQHKEQTLLFLHNPDYVFSYVGRPGWVACLLGDFCTQYYWYIGAGPTIVALWLMVVWLVAWVVFKRLMASSDWAMIVATFVALWEWLRECAFDYPLSATIALAGGMSLFLIFAALKDGYARTIAGIALLAFAYWCFAYGAWALLVLIVISLLLRKRWTYAIGFALLGVIIPFKSYPATNFWSWPNLTRERAMAIDTEAYWGHWHNVARMANEGKSGYLDAFYYNLGQGMRGHLADSLLHHPQEGPYALLPMTDRNSNYLYTAAAGEAWYRLGDFTFAEHSTILGMIFSPRSEGTRYIKRLAEIAIINGDSALADKYLTMLEATAVHSGWAKRMRAQDPKDPAIKQLREIAKLKPTQDTLRFSSDIPGTLRALLRDNPDNDLAYQYLMSVDLLSRDLKSFETDYKLQRGRARIYDEAMLISLLLRNATEEELQASGIPEATIDDFVQYTRLFNASGRQSHVLKQRFGNTYWYYYHFSGNNLSKNWGSNLEGRRHKPASDSIPAADTLRTKALMRPKAQIIIPDSSTTNEIY